MASAISPASIGMLSPIFGLCVLNIGSRAFQPSWSTLEKSIMPVLPLATPTLGLATHAAETSGCTHLQALWHCSGYLHLYISMPCSWSRRPSRSCLGSSAILKHKQFPRCCLTHLLEVYATPADAPHVPALLDMLMMEPLPCFRMVPITARDRRTGAVRLTAITRSHRSSVRESTLPKLSTMPATFASTSIC